MMSHRILTSMSPRITLCQLSVRASSTTICICRGSHCLYNDMYVCTLKSDWMHMQVLHAVTPLQAGATRTLSIMPCTSGGNYVFMNLWICVHSYLFEFMKSEYMLHVRWILYSSIRDVESCNSRPVVVWLKMNAALCVDRKTFKLVHSIVHTHADMQTYKHEHTNNSDQLTRMHTPQQESYGEKT